MAEEQGLKIDGPGFEKAKQESYEASKRGGKKDQSDLIKLNVHELSELNDAKVPKTNDEFKYGSANVEGTILKLHDGTNFVDEITEPGKKYGIILDKTCFYAEQGGQEYDTGKIVIDDAAEFNVENVQLYNGFVFHTGSLEEGNDPEGRVAHGCYISNAALAKGIDGSALAKKVSSIIGGKAGGKGNVFQGMGDKPAAIKDAVDDLESLFKEKLSI
ncbi:Alanine--tRNA ligase [Fusarium falciforme]|nr:Alanine--tRNA ligase [Fusarium falciforme]